MMSNGKLLLHEDRSKMKSVTALALAVVLIPVGLSADEPSSPASADVSFAAVSCCGGQNETAAQPKTTKQQRPRMSVAELQELQLPDVRIIAVKHRPQGLDDHILQEERTFAGVSGSGDIRVPHVTVDGVIGGSIHFELLLPDDWNSRFVMGGGGGFVGRVINWARFTVNRGFATVGTDTGHQSPSAMNGDWALNDVEAQVNFGYLAVHRTTEVAKAIIRLYYGGGPEYSYFIGCSRADGGPTLSARL